MRDGGTAIAARVEAPTVFGRTVAPTRATAPSGLQTWLQPVDDLGLGQAQACGLQ
jgi:hypothetical protein